jgi:hypothetical protein
MPAKSAGKRRMAPRKPALKGDELDAVQRANSAARLAAKAVKDAARLIALNKQAVPPMTKVEMEELIAKTTSATMALTFKLLGVNIKDDEDLEQFRKDMEYARAWRLAVQKGTRMSFTVTLTIILTGLAGVIALGFKTWLGK